MMGVTIFGSTGSIGINTLAVMDRHRERYRAVALCANTNDDRLFEQCLSWRPRVAVLNHDGAAERLNRRLIEAGLNGEIEVRSGVAGLIHAATMSATDAVMAAIVGAAGLRPTLAAAEAGKRVLLANKEALVMAGQPFMDAIRDHDAQLLPIDSEHNALFQCLPSGCQNMQRAGVRRLLLTGSGGPFLRTPANELYHVTPDQACAHPNWSMGRKISVDSATMMNKGLEVIEACWLFAAPIGLVEVILHPQSVVHSMVEYQDGSVLAQLGQPDMRTPIAHALAWPERVDSGVSPLDFTTLAGLEFARPDPTQFPCLRLAREAFQRGGTACSILNAANERAVAAFLEHRIRFTDIAPVIEQTLEHASIVDSTDLTSSLTADHNARLLADELILGLRSIPKSQPATHTAGH